MTTVRSLGLATAIWLLAGSGAFAQDDKCSRDSYTCFEPMQVFMHSAAEIDEFIQRNHEELGLTGGERFDCTRSVWADGDPQLANFGYDCEQVSVRGLRAMFLEVRVRFWSADNDVARFYCQCVPEDQQLPVAHLTATGAQDEAIQFIVSRFPHIGTPNIAFLDGPELVVQPRRFVDDPNAFRLAWTMSFRLPAAQEQAYGRLQLDYDAVTGEPILVWDRDSKLFYGGIPGAVIDDLQAKLGAPSNWSDAQFREYQTATAFLYRGAAEVAYQRRRLESLGSLVPDERSRFALYFRRPLDVTEVAKLANDYGLSIDGMVYFYSRSDGKTGWGRIDELSELDGALTAKLSAAIEQHYMEVLEKDNGYYISPSDRQDVLNLLSSHTDLRFAQMVVTMDHRSGLFLADEEVGDRLLAVNVYLERFPLIQPFRY